MPYIIFWIISLLLVYYLTKLKTKNRIEEIISLINSMRQQNYCIPMKQDEFSILEDQIYKIFIELVEEKERARINSRNQIEYLEDIAHQIKTPITKMLFSVETIDVSNLENDKMLLLKKQLQRLNSLTDVLLKLSSLDSKEDKMKKENIIIYELIEYSLEIVEPPNHINIVLDSSLADKIIKGNFYWISEAIINILKNAIGIQKCTKIEIKAEKNPLYTSLIIRDNAGGIQNDEIRKIFKRFYKTPDSKGFGIGLAMAKSIVEKNNGDIEAYNVDDGAEFKIKFYNIT